MKPSKNSHKTQIKNALLSGARLTNYIAFVHYGTVDFRKIISDLRKIMFIKDEWKTDIDGSRYKIYFIDEPDTTKKVQKTRANYTQNPGA